MYIGTFLLCLLIHIIPIFLIEKLIKFFPSIIFNFQTTDKKIALTINGSPTLQTGKILDILKNIIFGLLFL